MNYQLITESPSWLLIICLLAGLIYSWVLYRKETSFAELKPFVLRIMALFRFFTVTILCILLLSPLIKTVFREIEKPLLILVQDVSSSVVSIRDSVNFKQNFRIELEELKTQLQDDFDVREFSVGDQMSEGINFEYDNQETDLSTPVQELRARYSGRNLGAVILSTDGLYNKGTNPLYSYSELKVPVYTIGLGDTTVMKDLLVTGLNHNKTVFFGNTFPVEITVDARKCAGENVQLTITKQNKEIFSRAISISSNRFNLVVPAFLEANEKGMSHYVVTLTSLENEINYTNNSRSFFIDVTDNRQVILNLANSPHPDLGAIKNLLEANPNYELKQVMLNEFDGNIQGINLAILHQLPSLQNNAAAIIEKLNNSEIPILYILGSQTNINAFNTLSTGVKITDHRGNLTEIMAEPARDFALFTMDEEVMRRISSFPPLITPFGNFNRESNIYSLLNQRIGTVKTEMPLLYFNSAGNQKSAVLAGEGLWKWRLREFADHNNTNAITALLTKTVQYLATREKTTPFRLFFKNSYAENEPIIMDAEFYNESGELVNTSDVQISITNDSGNNFPYTFSRTDKAYSLNAGYLPAGVYKFSASIRSSDKTHSEAGSFNITSLQVEQSETIANHNVLSALSDRTGGTFYQPGNLESLIAELKNREDIKPVSYLQKRLDDVINLKAIFALIMLLLTLEWFMRKRSGAY